MKQNDKSDSLKHLSQNMKEVSSITHFGFTTEDKPLELGEDSSFTTVDLLYLMKLCQFENEYKRIRKLNMLSYKASNG